MDDKNKRTHLKQLEDESIFLLREVAAEFERPVILYSVGKDSSVLVHLARKAFYPGRIPFPLLHVDTGFKFPEMLEFRDNFVKSINAELIVHRNEDAIKNNTNPYDLGTQKCCSLLKTEALLSALEKYEVDAAIGGARRDEEKSRAKERVYSFRDSFGQWDPKNQRPELWKLYNGKLNPGESIRVFPLSNWTEMDVWHYIQYEKIPIVPLYFAENRPVVKRNGQLIPSSEREKGASEVITCRFRTLGCSPCTGAVSSDAETLEDIIDEMIHVKTSERSTRIIDHDNAQSMELKKREGYF